MPETIAIKSPAQTGKQKTTTIRTGKVIAVSAPTLFKAQAARAADVVLDKASDASRRVAAYAARLMSDQTRTQSALQKLGRSQHQVYLALTDGPYRMYMDYLKEDATTRRLVIEKVNAELEKTGSETRDATSDLMRIVKVNIYGGESYKELPKAEKDRLRRQCSAYHAVLKDAHKNDVAPDALVDWIKSKGGIEYIRLGKIKQAKAGIPYRDRLSRAKDKVASCELQRFEPDEKLALTASDEGCTFLLVATYRNGSVQVNAVVRDNNAVEKVQLAFFDAEHAEKRDAEVPSPVEAVLNSINH